MLFNVSVFTFLTLFASRPNLVILEFIEPGIKEFFHQKIENILESKIYNHMIEQDYKFINWIHDDLVFVPNDINI